VPESLIAEFFVQAHTGILDFICHEVLCLRFGLQGQSRSELDASSAIARERLFNGTTNKATKRIETPIPTRAANPFIEILLTIVSENQPERSCQRLAGGTARQRY